VKLLVGLGNPGEKYSLTRHNIGFMVAEKVAEQQRIALKKKGYQGIYGVGRLGACETTILLPLTYMNRSGASVQGAFQSLGKEPGDLIVIHDDLDLPFGRLKIKEGGGHGGHNGLRDIIATLGRADFVRLRIGVGRPEHGNVTAHVLSRFSPAEIADLPRLLATATAAAERIVQDGALEAMNHFNNFNLFDAE
jgi:PTH1 family peptidyl-tRNA hydrolase